MATDSRDYNDDNARPRVVRGRRVVTPDGVRPASIHIDGGRIGRVGAWGDTGESGMSRVVDAGNRVVMPGLVDTHVHVNEPGRTEWEGFETATRAAAAGGVTTLLDMPLNSVPATTSVAALREKADAASGKIWIDVGFIGGVVPGNETALGDLAAAGVRAFKCFLVPSGVAEFQHVSQADLRVALPLIAQTGLPLMVHAEMPEIIEAATLEAMAGEPTSYVVYRASRPPAAEHEAIALMIELSAATGARVHIVHVSSAESTWMIEHARSRGVAISAETCPHYLSIDVNTIADGATDFICAPPFRGRTDQEGLCDALDRGRLDMIVSDHSPCPPILKRRDVGDFFAAWGGIASLQLGASVIWTTMCEQGIPIDRLVEWMAVAPAKLAGLTGRKGAIAPEYDADLVVFDPDRHQTVTADRLLHRHAVTPYLGARLRGVVDATYVCGMLAYDHARGPVAVPNGQLLLPTTS